MYVDKNSVIINNINMGQYLTQADFEYNKIWSSDTGRENFAGVMTGTLVGIFPKLVLNFRRLTPAEVHTLAPIFDSASQTVQYYDDNKAQMVTMSTYAGDWKVTSTNIHTGEPFSVSFISRQRRA